MATTLDTRSTGFKLSSLLSSQDAALGVAIVMVIMMLLVPMPALMLDLFIAANIAISLGVILTTVYVHRAMDFSSFPTVLLLITLFRLGISVGIARAILVTGAAGKAIDTFGNLLLGGNYVVGVVIFLILMIIQWVVINNGAGRVAEVAARFTLDAMPGKQLSIDADLNAGIISDDEARARRKEIQAEADFYGAMDGASKFVKGDATAAVIVMVINVIGGFLIGILQRGMDFEAALQTYTIVTVGAGLAIQIPSLLVSASAGLLVTRSGDSSLGKELSTQMSNFTVLLVGAVIMAMVSLIPGLPKIPFFMISGALGAAGYYVRRLEQQAVVDSDTIEEIEAGAPESPEDMLQMVVVDPLELEVGYGLIPLIDNEHEDNLLERITGIRRQLMTELGLVLPIVRVRDNMRLKPQMYRIKIRGEEIARGELMLGRYLAIPGATVDENLQGIKTIEPAFGLPAIWITDVERSHAELMGYTVVAPISVLSTHLTEVVRSHSSELLSRQLVSEMVDQLRYRMPATIEGVVPDIVSLGEVQSVLRALLQERVPIRDLASIIEVLSNMAGTTRDPLILAEAVRQNMARTLTNQYRDENEYIHVITMAPQIEEALRNVLGPSEGGGVSFQIDANTAQTLIQATGEQMERQAQAGHFPILLTSRELRLAFRRLVEKSLPSLVVLAFSEISGGTKVQAHGMVEIAAGPENQSVEQN